MILPLAAALAFTLPLTTACSGRGSQAFSTPAQSAEAPQQEPAEQASGNGGTPAQPLLAIESSPPAPSRLHRAAMAGDVEQVKQLLDQGHEINQQHARGLSALHEAVTRGHADVVAVFMEAGADPDDPTAQGKTPLHLAAEIGSVEICTILLEAGADPALADQDGATALGVAVREGHAEVVRMFVDKNPDIFSDRTSGNLFYDAAFHGHREIVAFLIEAAGGHYGFSIDIALQGAATNGHTDIARLLVQAGADVTVQNGDNKTPVDLANEQGHKTLARMLEQIPKLFEAVAAGDLEAVKRLVEEEQSTNRRHPRDGHTPLHEAVRQGRPEVVQVLLEAGADLSLRDKSGEYGATALDIAIEESHIEIAKILRNAGGPISINIRPFLQSAVSNRNKEMVKLLTEYLIETGRKNNRSIYEDINYNVNDYSYYSAIDEIRFGTSLLHIAATNGSTEIARLLVQAGAYVMAQNDDHKTPIDLAHEQGHEDLAQMLEKVSALREAAVAGDAEKVQQLLAAGTLTDAQDAYGATVLYRVIETYLVEPAHLYTLGYLDESRPVPPATEGHMEVVRLLIQAGAKVDSIIRWAGRIHRNLTLSNSNPLHVAALAGQAEIVKLLIEAGKDINGYLNFRNHRNYNNALTLALSENPNQEVAKLLIQAGADVNAPKVLGAAFVDTPLHIVAAMVEEATMSVNIAKALINAGANLNPQLGRPNTFAFGVGRTPLHTASSVNHIEMARLLIKHGANVNAKDESDNSPLHLAIYEGHGKLAKLLIESGAYVDSRNYNGNLPIQVAAFAGLPEVIKLLIEAGSPVNDQDQVGDTPLHDAALQGQVEAAQVLLEAGADVNIKNNAGKTPLDLARQHGHGNVAAVLQAAGGSASGAPG